MRFIVAEWRWLLALCATLLFELPAVAATVDFEDLSPDTPYTGPGGGFYWKGPAENGEDLSDPLGGTRRVGTFESGGVEFVNRFNSGFGSWSGFSYSNTTDTATAGFANQFSAYPGAGFQNSANYGVAGGHLDNLDANDAGQLAELPWLQLPEGALIQSAYVTNTTYAARSMLEGDAFAKKFGGPGGADPDWLKLTVYGTDDSGAPLPGTAELYLADYRSPDPGQDYVLDQWTLLDLSALADAARLYFNLSSTDVGTWGMNTPAFFAIDDLHFPATPALQAGDADQDLDFDQLDIIRVSQAAKYLSGEPATWGEGDWDGAPGGGPGNPPVGNGRFDQQDIIAALRTGLYRTGPYGAEAGLSQQVVTADLPGIVSREGGGGLGRVDRAVVPIAEPSTTVLLGLGLAGLLLVRRHPKNSRGYAVPFKPGTSTGSGSNPALARTK